MLKIIYKLFKHRFNELMVEDMFGSIPKDLQEPALDFLANGKEKLEKFFLIQTYTIQRRMARDHKHADVYVGMLIIIKAFIAALSNRKTTVQKVYDNSLPVEDVRKDLDRTAEFIAEGINSLQK